jgi:hypothetical protein
VCSAGVGDGGELVRGVFFSVEVLEGQAAGSLGGCLGEVVRVLVGAVREVERPGGAAVEQVRGLVGGSVDRVVGFDEFGEDVLEYGGVVVVEDLAGHGDVDAGVEAVPADGVAGVLGELADEGALGTAVAFPEGVDGVQPGVVGGRLVGEGVQVQAAEVVFGGEAVEEGAGRGEDGLGGREFFTFRDGGGPELAGPGVDGAEEGGVDGAQVVEVVVALDGVELESVEGCQADVGFEAAEQLDVGDAEEIPGDAGDGVEVTVGHHGWPPC